MTSFLAQLRARRGFTLIELLTVVVIVGILAAVVVPRFLEQRDAGEDAHTANLVSVSYQEAKTFWAKQTYPNFVGTAPMITYLTGANPEITYTALAGTGSGPATRNQVGVYVYNTEAQGRGNPDSIYLAATSDSGDVISIMNEAGDETKLGFPGTGAAGTAGEPDPGNGGTGGGGDTDPGTGDGGTGGGATAGTLYSYVNYGSMAGMNTSVQTVDNAGTVSTLGTFSGSSIGFGIDSTGAMYFGSGGMGSFSFSKFEGGTLGSPTSVDCGSAMMANWAVSRDGSKVAVYCGGSTDEVKVISGGSTTTVASVGNNPGEGAYLAVSNSGTVYFTGANGGDLSGCPDVDGVAAYCLWSASMTGTITRLADTVSSGAVQLSGDETTVYSQQGVYDSQYGYWAAGSFFSVPAAGGATTALSGISANQYTIARGNAGANANGLFQDTTNAMGTPPSFAVIDGSGSIVRTISGWSTGFSSDYGMGPMAAFGTPVGIL